MAVLGLRIVEVPATERLITGGLRASRLANVSLRFMMVCGYNLTHQTKQAQLQYFPLYGFG